MSRIDAELEKEILDKMLELEIKMSEIGSTPLRHLLSEELVNMRAVFMRSLAEFQNE